MRSRKRSYVLRSACLGCLSELLIEEPVDFYIGSAPGRSGPFHADVRLSCSSEWRGEELRADCAERAAYRGIDSGFGQVAGYPPFPSCVNFPSPHVISQSLHDQVIDLARLIVAFAPQSLHTNTGLGDRFMDALLRASDWDDHWTPPMTKPKERNILLLLRTIANALQENTEFENITWALKVPVLLLRRLEGGAYFERQLTADILALRAPPE
jgi:hypothetical protein